MLSALQLFADYFVFSCILDIWIQGSTRVYKSPKLLPFSAKSFKFLICMCNSKQCVLLFHFLCNKEHILWLVMFLRYSIGCVRLGRCHVLFWRMCSWWLGQHICCWIFEKFHGHTDITVKRPLNKKQKQIGHRGW